MMDELEILPDISIGRTAFVVGLGRMGAVSDEHGYAVRIGPEILQGVYEYRQVFRITAQPGFITDDNGNIRKIRMHSIEFIRQS